MNGSIFLCNAAGRAIRLQAKDVCLGEVIDVSGNFQIGESINVCFRGNDGGQYAIATGATLRDSEWLQAKLGPHQCTRRTCDERDQGELVLLASGIRLLWPAAGQAN